MPTSENQEEVLFALALEKPAPDRAAFLDVVCSGNPSLRQRLADRLAACAPPQEPPAGTAPGAAPTIKIVMPEPPDEAVGQTLGRYKLLERLGEGGCGVVYVAEQTQPVRRRVALKVIKLGMDTKAVVARFEAERQALAMMDHPNIAKVLDAGATETGRPYFVMELVRGIRITDYCDQNNLSAHERLELFIKICQAIQHAHQKGIIHRDIKPSNILVTLHDGVPVPKVIDFGIAKATEGRLADSTVYTQLHQFIGTPAYMSPEQAEMSGLDIDTRSDIYSLGVLLYELLTGSTPFDSNELVSQGIDEMRRTIREKDPLRPSTKLSQTLEADRRQPAGAGGTASSAQEESSSSARRLSQARETVNLLRGDLDWIVMKCLEKDRTRRYETANGVAADLRRHLNHEPIMARPPSAAYRFQKAIHRHKAAYLAGAAVFMALLLGIVACAWQAMRAKRAERVAEQAETQAKESAEQAMQSRNEAEKLSSFMLDDLYYELKATGQNELLAGLARRALAYYDRLPASLRTPETVRRRATALARLSLFAYRSGDATGALKMTEEVESVLEPMVRNGDQSEQTIYALGMAYSAAGQSYRDLIDQPKEISSFQKGLDLLRPFATKPEGFREIKLEYAELLNYRTFAQTPSEAIGACEQALAVLAGMGALDLQDLDAASAWADVADTEARNAMALGRWEDTKRIENQMLTLARGVLERRPADLHAKQDCYWAAEALSTIAKIEFHDAEALTLCRQGIQGVEDYLRSNPKDIGGEQEMCLANFDLVALLARMGNISGALQAAYERLQEQNRRAGTSILPNAMLWAQVAFLEAQRGNRTAAEQALESVKRIMDDYVKAEHLPPATAQYFAEIAASQDRQMRLAFGEDAFVYQSAADALPRIPADFAGIADNGMRVTMYKTRMRTLNDECEAALHLGHYAEVESLANALVALSVTPPPGINIGSQDDDPHWGLILEAQALVGEGRAAEALT